MTGSSSPTTISTKQARIAKLAKESPTMVITTLAHHVDMEWMREAHRLTRKDGAVGVDGQTAEEYEANLDANLESLLNRFKSGSYKAPPVRRVEIPKPGKPNEKRPLGIPTFEDKVLQRAVAMLMVPIYEQDFLDCSSGFRPGRSTKTALAQARNHLMSMGGGLVLEIDIRKFFDNLDHSHLRDILHKRVKDGVALRAIGKWLNAGVWTGDCLEVNEKGSPQGGVISPLLSNIYLHEVLDTWFERDVKPQLKRQAHLVRYADDAVIVFENEEDAKRVMAVLPKRFGKYGLTLHPEKTRLLDFRRPRNSNGTGANRPQTFDLLGFTHYWGRSRRGFWVVKRKTAKDRFRRGLLAIYQWCKRNLHEPVKKQWTKLCTKLKGHYSYYGITCNTPSIREFRHRVERIWRHWLNRRSHKARMTWEKWAKLAKHYPLPAAVRPKNSQPC